MTQTIKIKRSTGSSAPSTLAQGELAYSKDGNKLYIGDPATANTPILINEGKVVGVDASLTDVIDVNGSKNLAAQDAGSADAIVFWDDSASKLTYMTAAQLRDFGGVDTDDNVTFNSLTLNGNLTVNGTTTTLNTATLDVQDTNITLNHGSGDTSGSANGAGITIQDAVDASTDASITWNTTGNAFNFSNAIQLGGDLLVSSSRRIYASDGTDTKAAFGFSSSSSTGLSYGTGNRIKFLAGGAVKAYIQPGSSNPITPVMYVDGRTEINGRVYATGDGNSGNWKSAYDWGDHSQAGYAAGNHNHNGVYEPVFTKNNAFNKNFGSAAGTVAQGNDSRINNGQTAFGWGNHASQGYVAENDATFTDRWLELNRTSTVTNGNGGIYVARSGTNQDAVLYWDESTDQWKFGLEGYGQSIGIGDITQVTISSTDGSITGGGTGTSGDLSFDLEVATIDGGTY